MRPQSDEKLFTASRQGNPAAFEALYRRYEKPLYGFILHYLRNRQESQEVFHEAFCTVLQSGTDLISDGFRPWIYRVARNLCLNRLRSRKAQAPLLQEPECSGFTEDLLERERLVALRGAVAELSPSHSEVYRLRVAGLSYEEMAARLGVPLGTVKSRLHEMVARLKEVMRKWDVN